MNRKSKYTNKYISANNKQDFTIYSPQPKPPIARAEIPFESLGISVFKDLHLNYPHETLNIIFKLRLVMTISLALAWH